jgi:protein-S-isoprenylcysteine O-methyltransferase Ste14
MWQDARRGKIALNLSAIWEILYCLWVASEIYLFATTRTKSRTGKVRDRGSLTLLWIAIFASMTICEWHRYYALPDLFGGGRWLEFAGIFTVLAGLAIRWSAIRTLGKAFSVNVAIKESQRVCKEGLYRIVRHPSYTGLLLIFAGVGLHARNWLSFLTATVPTTAAMLYRIHVEEIALREAFGEEYTAYAAATKRLVPAIY